MTICTKKEGNPGGGGFNGILNGRPPVSVNIILTLVEITVRRLQWRVKPFVYVNLVSSLNYVWEFLKECNAMQ